MTFYRIAELVIDIIGCVMSNYNKILLYIASLVAINFNYNWGEIKLSPKSDITFCILSKCDYTRRIITWFYYFHQDPDESDWADFLQRFQLDNVPPHYISCSDGVTILVSDITLGNMNYRGTRTVSYNDFVESGYIKMGGLTPARLISDAVNGH